MGLSLGVSDGLLLGTALLKSQELPRSKGFVVSQSRSLDEVLEVSAREEVAQVYKLAVILVLYIDYAVSVLSSAYGLAVDDDVALGAYDGKRDQRANAVIELSLFFLVLLAIKRVQANVVVLHLCTDPLFEEITLVEGEAVGLCNDWYDVDDVGKLLHDGDVNGPQSVARGVDKEEATVDARVCDVPVTHGGELFSEVGRVLIFDVLNDGVPAVLVVDLVAISGRVYDVELELDTVLDDEVRDRMNLRGDSGGLVCLDSSL